ncbi:MAG: putative ATP-dependent exoDNAse [Acidimicrobiales bacterium]|nr:putative ATP-dependent exoDNAse [Acidimicrobiales bacterium]
MAWFRMMGSDSVTYHRRTVLDGADDHPGAARIYYGGHGETPLRWGGSLAARLGLDGPVDDAGYDAVFGPGGATDPHLGVRMVRTRRPGVELVVSAHKSVAVLGVLGAVDDMHAIVDAETDATMGFLDEWFRRQGGRRDRAQTRTATSGLLWARTRHLTTRAGDPEPHDHILIANLTEMLDARGGWKALDTGGLRDLVHAATMVGRHAAAEKAVELGYAIEADPGPSGRLAHWRLVGIGEDACELFSKRSDEIRAAVNDGGFDSHRARAVAARRTRVPKDDESPRDLWLRWRDELGTLGLSAQDYRRRFNRLQDRLRQPLRALTDTERADVAQHVIGANGPLADAKVFTRPDVIRATAPLLYGCEHAELDRVASAVTAHDEAIPLVGQPGARGRAWAVGSALATEHAISDIASDLAQRPGPEVEYRVIDGFIGHCEARSGIEVTEGQERAALDVCTSGRGLDVIIGVAGSGKTTVLEVMGNAFERMGHRVIGTATSGQAARTLNITAGIEARTIASTLARLESGSLTLDRNTVLVIDEAGMTDDRDLLRLLQAAREAGAKAIVVGDHRQLGAVGAGGGLEALIERHPDAVHMLRENIRQHDPGERVALEHLRTGDVARAVGWYRDHDRIDTAQTRSDAIAAAVADWHDDTLDGAETLLLAWRRADVAALNHAARHTRIDDGTITGPELEAPGGRRYAAGDRIVTLAPGAHGRFVTSERATVTSIRDDHLGVRFDDGRTDTLAGIEIDLDHLDHAYALTVHRTQGATVDRAHLLADGGGRELTYVALSRARQTTTIHTVADDLDQAVEDLEREWGTERRQRWVLDTETPATDATPQRPNLAPKPGPDVQADRDKIEHRALANTEPVDPLSAKARAIQRRFDQLQHRPPNRGRDRGLGIG